jgi:hypothetical protein
MKNQNSILLIYILDKKLKINPHLIFLKNDFYYLLDFRLINLTLLFINFKVIILIRPFSPIFTFILA